MSRFKNDLGEDRVTPTLDYGLVAAGATFVVPDGEWDHWVAGGFTPLDPRPAPPAPEPAPTQESDPAPAAKPTAKPAAAAAEGTETA